jgi:branched-subunit amino acid transport protein
MTSELIWMIAGMAVATYLPRMLPLVLLNTETIPPFVQGVLKNVPYAILGALIFPGILTFSEDIWFGIIGAITAFAAAYFGANLILVVLCSITALSIYSFLV